MFVVLGNQLIPPRGATRLEAGDHLFVITHTGERAAVERILSEGVADTAGEEGAG